MDSETKEILSIAADLVSIFGISAFALLSFIFTIFKKANDYTSVVISIWVNRISKALLIVAVVLLISLFGYEGVSSLAFLERQPLLFSMFVLFVILAITLSLGWILSVTIWTWSLSQLNFFLSLLGVGRYPSKKLEILNAVYGADDRFLDLTAILIGKIDNNHLRIIATNELAGDPSFGKTKELRVIYRFGANPKEVTVKEGEELVLPTSSD
jgi:hypothetical protein